MLPQALAASTAAYAVALAGPGNRLPRSPNASWAFGQYCSHAYACMPRYAIEVASCGENRQLYTAVWTAAVVSKRRRHQATSAAGAAEGVTVAVPTGAKGRPTKTALTKLKVAEIKSQLEQLGVPIPNASKPVLVELLLNALNRGNMASSVADITPTQRQNVASDIGDTAPTAPEDRASDNDDIAASEAPDATVETATAAALPTVTPPSTPAATPSRDDASSPMQQQTQQPEQPDAAPQQPAAAAAPQAIQIPDAPAEAAPAEAVPAKAAPSEAATAAAEPVQAVSPPSIQQQEPPRTAESVAEAAAATPASMGLMRSAEAGGGVSPAGEDLSSDRAGYYSIELEGCEYLIASDLEGRLDLRDIYIVDKELGVSGRPAYVGDMPARPHHYQEAAWTKEYLGDSMKYKEPWVKVQKVFLVQIDDSFDHYVTNLEQIFVLDSDTRDVRKAVVERRTKSADPGEQILRITRDGRFVIDSPQNTPQLEDVVQAFENDLESISQAPAEVDPDVEEELEVEDLGDFDSPDVPAVDLE